MIDRPISADRLAEPEPVSARALIARGLAVVAFLAFGLTIWSVTLPLDSAVIAPASVEVEGNRRLVQHLEGGIVRVIRVREGQNVTAGQSLIELDDTVLQAELETLDVRLFELRARQRRLQAERDRLDEFPSLPPAIERQAGRQTIVAVEAELFDTRRQRRETERDLLDEQVVQNETRINGYTAQILSIDRQIQLKQEELRGLQVLNERGYAPTHRLLAIEGQVEAFIGDRAALIATRAETRSRIAEAELQISRMDREFLEDVLSQLAAAESEIASRAQRRIEVTDALERSIVRSPTAGRVLGLQVHTQSGVIGPGETIMNIVPADASLVVTARVSPQDVDAVAIGQAVLVRFSALGGQSVPEIDGELIEVSADALTDEMTGLPYYAAVVSLDASPNDTLSMLVPGMPSEAYIVTGSQTAFWYLVRPLSDAWARTFREN